MRLIDAKAETNRLYVSDFVFEQMQKIPTIDAVPVVRCKDCRIGRPSYTFGAGWVFCQNNKMTHQDTHFCGYGEPKP